MKSHSNMLTSRRHFIKAFALVLGSAAAGSAIPGCTPAAAPPATSAPTSAKPPVSASTPAPAGQTQPPAASSAPATKSDFDWRKYAGKNIRYLGWTDLWSTAIEAKVPEFEQLTGIKLDWERIPQEQARQKTLLELTAKSTTLDLLHVAPQVEGLKYLRAGWIQTLDQFLGDPKLMPAEFEVGDFFPSLLDACRNDGKQTTLPTQIEVICLMYRKDLFDKAGLKVPGNFDELEQAAKKLHNPPDVYGIVNRGSAKDAPIAWCSYMYSYGGDYLTKDKQCNITSPEVLNSMDYYARLHRAYAPPGITAMGWTEAMTVLAGGKAAMHTDANTRRAVLEDPTKSMVAGKMGYAVFPAGPVSSSPANWTVGPSISKFSENKEAAWYFILWALGKESQLATHLKGVAAARKSAWGDQRYTGTETIPEWRETTMKTMSLSTKGYSPPVVAVGQVRDRVGEVVLAALEARDFRAEAQRACADIAKIMAQTETS